MKIKEQHKSLEMEGVLSNMDTDKGARQLFKKIPPAEKFDILFQALNSLDAVVGDLINNNKLLQETVVLLSKKLEAIAALQNIKDDQIDKAIEAKEMQVLKQKVDNLIEKGVLHPSEQVDENSFLVLRVLKDGKVHTHRAQLPFYMLTEDLKGKFNGLKKGDAVQTEEFLYEIQEIFAVKKEEVVKSEERSEENDNKGSVNNDSNG